jgi:hypothetical protein
MKELRKKKLRFVFIVKMDDMRTPNTRTNRLEGKV